MSTIVHGQKKSPGLGRDEVASLDTAVTLSSEVEPLHRSDILQYIWSLVAADFAPCLTGQLWKVSQAWINAFKDDPVMEYTRADAKRPPNWVERTTYSTTFALWLTTDKVMLTIDAVALILVNKPGSPNSPVESGLNSLGIFVLAYSQGKRTKEQLKRMKEFESKIIPAIDSVVPPERRSRMYYVDGIGTDPAYQGHGFGSMLLRTITEEADKQSRSCWLLSSNTTNDLFYNSHGFFTVASITLGEDNPEWDKKPVLVQLMIREQQVLEAHAQPTSAFGQMKLETAPKRHFSTPFRIRI